MSRVTEFHVDNKRIIHNTLFLYFRMFILMLVTLYTSRVILMALGVEDYGIYDVVGSLVTLFAIFREAVSSTFVRYLTYEIGASGNQLKVIFSTSLLIQLIVAAVIIILAETIGLWFLYNRMCIPDGRMGVALWCYQLSLIAFIARLLSMPYDAVIIAHERMSAFAKISIIDGIGQLLIAWCIAFSPFDKLLFFALLNCLLSFLVRMVYVVYCRSHFEESKCGPHYNKVLFSKVFAFSGWNLIGTTSYQLMNKGVDILVNIFYGVTVNASRAIASQVSGAISLFVNNFTRAINPQITKAYASGQKQELYSLICSGTKFSYFIMLFFSIPILCETKTILNIWLVKVPDHTVAFVQLSIIVSMLEILSKSMETAAFATGKIWKYQVYVRGSCLIVLPLAWILVYVGYAPEITYVAVAIGVCLMFFVSLYVLSDLIDMPIRVFLKEVISKILFTTILASIIPLFLYTYLDTSLLRFVIIVISSVFTTLISILFYGVSASERNFILGMIKSIVKKL